MYLNACGRSVLPKHAACVEKTKFVVFGSSRCVNCNSGLVIKVEVGCWDYTACVVNVSSGAVVQWC